MAEKIKIAELSIDVDELTKDMQTTKKSIEGLIKTQKNLKDSGDTTSKGFIENEAKLKSLKTEFNGQIKTLQGVTNATNTLNSELGKEAKSLAGAEASNKTLRKARANLNLATKEGKDQLALVNKKIDENTNFMKDNQDAQVKNKMNVGNYTQSIREALGIERAHAVAMQTMIPLQATYNMVVGQSTGAMKLFKIALASTGIGLIVIALGSLIAYFATTQEGADALAKVMTPLKEVMGSVLGVVQKLGGALAKLFSGGGISAFLGDVKEVGSNLGKTMKEAVSRGKEMAALQQNLNKSNASYITDQARLKKEFQEQKKISEDTTKTIAEREEAARKAIGVQEEIRKGTVTRLNQEAQLLKLKQMANDTSDEEKAQLATKLAEIDKALEEEAGKTTEAQNKLNGIVKEGIAKRKEARDAATQSNLARLEQEYALYQEQQRLKAKTDEDELAQLKANAVKEAEILDFKLNNRLISETEYQTAKLALANSIREKEGEIAQQDLDRAQAFNDRKKELEEELYLAGLETDEEREVAKLEKEQEREDAEIERMKISAEKKAELKKLLEEKFQNDFTGIQKKWGDKRAKDEETRAKQELATKEAIASAKADIAAGLSNLLSTIAGKDAGIQKAALLFEKGVAASRVIISTQVANAKTAAQMGAIPAIPFIIANNVMMGVSLATIAAQAIQGMSKINKQSTNSKSFGRGGVLSGASHANGGIQTPYGELEGEEAVINKRSTAMYAPLLSAINEAGGGRKFAEGGMLGTSGVSRSMSLIDYDMLGRTLALANRSLPAPIVGVDEISSTQSRVQTIETRANF